MSKTEKFPVCARPQDFRLVLMCLELATRISRPPAVGCQDSLIRHINGNPIFYAE